MNNLLVNFLIIERNGQARQSLVIDYMKESHLFKDERKLVKSAKHFYRFLAPMSTRETAQLTGSWMYLALTDKGFAVATDHEMPNANKRIFAYEAKTEKFVEVMADGPVQIPVEIPIPIKSTSFFKRF